MTRITNRLNLPAPLVAAIERDPYVRHGDVSVTGLAKSPRQYWLERRHGPDLIEDASDRIWALLGSIGHKILERAEMDNHLSEETLTADVNGWKLSGTPDLLEPDGTLVDFKFLSVFAIKDAKPEFESQLNSYALLYELYGFRVKALRIVGILRDWSKRRSQREADYPQAGVVVREVPLWSDEQRRAYVEGRVTLLQANETVPDDALPDCTPDERWATDIVYATKKPGGKRAVRLFTDEDEARDFAILNKLDIDVRPGENIRCDSYCAVAPFCSTHKARQADEPPTV